MELGDPHNFGRRVATRGGRIYKPRTVLWEWLMLSPESPLRKFLGSDFGFLPSLAIDRKNGLVERISLSPLRSRSRGAELAAIVGRSLALWSWLGVADLHWENMALGVGPSPERRIVFGPLDIEMIFADLALPTQTKLIPEADPDYGEELRRAAGVRRVLSHWREPLEGATVVAIASAYHGTLERLDRDARSIAKIVSAVRGVRDAPIRVLLRATSDYARAATGAVWPPLLDCESEQLARGDVPYFFRLWGRRGIRYYRDARLRRVGFAPAPTEPLLPPPLRSPSRAILRKQGLLAVIGAFDHPALSGRHAHGDFAITLGARRILVDVAGERLACPRNLRAIVGSVHQDE